MSVPGTWTLHYDWACGGNYGNTQIIFNSNGTFSSPPYTGKWSSHDGQIIWRFDQVPDSLYGGAVVDSAMVGISSTLAGSNGCWYAIKTTATTKAFEELKPKHDVAGVAKR